MMLLAVVVLASDGFLLAPYFVAAWTLNLLSTFSAHYPQSFRKAAIINSPDFMVGFWKMVSGVLPASVRAKVVFLGNDYMVHLREELTDEALYWLQAPHDELSKAPFRQQPPPLEPLSSEVSDAMAARGV